MNRRDNFDNGHGKDEHRFSIDPRDAEFLLDVTRASKESAEWDKERSQRATDLLDSFDLKTHLIDAHGMSSNEIDFYDETAHSHIPELSNKLRDWSGPTVPALDHKDLLNLHQHDHTAGEYASDYPHTTLGDSHFHH